MAVDEEREKFKQFERIIIALEKDRDRELSELSPERLKDFIKYAKTSGELEIATYAENVFLRNK